VFALDNKNSGVEITIYTLTKVALNIFNKNYVSILHNLKKVIGIDNVQLHIIQDVVENNGIIDIIKPNIESVIKQLTKETK
jgi:hypothetical protein